MNMEKLNNYRYWKIVEELPEGWKIDNITGSPLHDCVFVTNGKSPVNGQQRALLRIKTQSSENPPPTFSKIEKTEKFSEKTDTKKSVTFPAQTVNELARLKFQEKLLQEILFDLTVCEIEGWDKTVYTKELQNLIQSISFNLSDFY